MTRSYILLTKGRVEIGRKFFTSCLDPALWIGITRANFNGVGKTPSSIEHPYAYE